MSAKAELGTDKIFFITDHEEILKYLPKDKEFIGHFDKLNDPDMNTYRTSLLLFKDQVNNFSIAGFHKICRRKCQLNSALTSAYVYLFL